ncbi:hypothetical protein SAMN05444398_103266 [Roseovarius pacificus]|uniref:Uncharacterized protein n=1 Tax=Roseovarius pacificus TaxID=337701 RepID=A0A1M7BJE5_9RHOB|nr:hypothetical protein [Roseovarius pacificus]GGO55180.1 hypothetical protein GCM10011315_17110 [Roseovarius pacificus]SHL55006.1 hypothetical protein SAMN05444398_103266 [Roseovarius pacificus]
MITRDHLIEVDHSLAEMRQLVDMLELIGNEMGGTVIENPHYAKMRNATCGVINAVAERADRAMMNFEALYKCLPEGARHD